MELHEIQARAMEIRKQYEEFEQKKWGRTWTAQEIALGFVGDVGTLAKLVLVKAGVREIEGADEKLAHELSDCLWSVIVLANKYNIDLEKVFLSNMDGLDLRIQGMMK